MKRLIYQSAFVVLGLWAVLLSFGCAGTASQERQTAPSSEEHEASWQLGPFEKYAGNPILTPQGPTWEAKDVFNPATWTDGETVYMLYRAEDSTGLGQWNGA